MLDTTAAANTIETVVAPSYEEAVFKNNAILQHFPFGGMSEGDTAYRWTIHSGANGSVTTFDENDALPDAGQQAFVRGAVSYIHTVGTMQITGHARAALRSGYINHIEDESTLLREDLADLTSTTVISGTNGLETAIDSTTAYAGLTRGATYFDSQETAVGGVMSFDAMKDMYYNLIDAEVGSRPTTILMSPTQESKFYDIAGQPGIKQFMPNDPASGMSNQQFNGVPIAAIPDMTNSIALFLDQRGSNWVYKIHRPLEVHFRQRAGDSDVFDFITAFILVCRNPKKQGKLTGLST